jgi:hypothetical protein
MLPGAARPGTGPRAGSALTGLSPAPPALRLRRRYRRRSARLPPVLGGQPVVGQVQVDPRRLDAQVPGLGLHASSAIPASRSRSGTCAAARGRSRAPARPRRRASARIASIPSADSGMPRRDPLSTPEHPTRARHPGRLVMLVGAQRFEEPVRGQDHPVMAPPLPSTMTSRRSATCTLANRSQHLTAAQPGQQHRQHHSPVPVRAQRGDQPVRLALRQRSSAGCAGQAHAIGGATISTAQAPT